MLAPDFETFVNHCLGKLSPPPVSNVSRDLCRLLNCFYLFSTRNISKQIYRVATAAEDEKISAALFSMLSDLVLVVLELFQDTIKELKDVGSEMSRIILAVAMDTVNHETLHNMDERLYFLVSRLPDIVNALKSRIRDLFHTQCTKETLGDCQAVQEFMLFLVASTSFLVEGIRHLLRQFLADVALFHLFMKSPLVTLYKSTMKNNELKFDVLTVTFLAQLLYWLLIKFFNGPLLERVLVKLGGPLSILSLALFTYYYLNEFQEIDE